jgi:hypothetical protein
MPIEDWAPQAIVPHLVTDDHHAHGILLPFQVNTLREFAPPAEQFLILSLWI